MRCTFKVGLKFKPNQLTQICLLPATSKVPSHRTQVCNVLVTGISGLGTQADWVSHLLLFSLFLTRLGPHQPNTFSDQRQNRFHLKSYSLSELNFRTLGQPLLGEKSPKEKREKNALIVDN
jgi:hypothetical protein